MINLLLKRMFEELNNELETEPDVSIILPCFSSMASTGEFVNAMTDEQVNQCIKMFLSTYAEAQAESVKVLLAILMYRPDKCASMLTTEVLEAAIKFSMISWNLYVGNGQTSSSASRLFFFTYPFVFVFL
jgi:hypothetical protein